jgi:hypothetical protein
VRLPSACAGTPNAKVASTTAAAELNNFLVIEVMANLPVETFVYDSFMTT